jgi:GT2 family glycosyltransferase
VARLACIIPVLGTTDGLETTLVSVLERRADDCEVVVVLNVPYDDPYQLSGEVKFLDAARGAGLVECLNVGIGATQAPIVHTLACGFEVADGWTERARTHFEDPRVAAVTPAIHHAADRERLIAAGVGYRRGGSKVIARQAASSDGSALQSVGPLLQAAFIRREALAAFDGILPMAVGDGLADIDLALTLRRAGWQIHFDSQCRVFAASIDEPQTIGFQAGLHAERLFWRHWAETGRLAGLIAHPATALGHIAGSTWTAPLHVLGRFIACCQFGSQRSYQQTLAAATLAASEAQAQWQSPVAESSRREGQSLRIDKPHPAGRRVEAEPVRGSHRKVVRE